MKELSFEKMESIQGGRFFGYGDWSASECSNGWQILTRTYYVFWIAADYDYKMVQCVDN